ncbi:uncharacterized protein LOC121402213 isoform X2 [Xenopus laevis]|uniref:Uncharacterized protein LOC121402213 isoform X2 n=1 Tax=Xenopus laevis TaxID=8355 RepID=A0A8J1MSB4_XENLA|nr:uncharacterized protein LOC121402213 isoform X2 [Xenopus laevis]
MAGNIDALLDRIRTEAERRGDDWLRQMLPDEPPQQAATVGMRTRRSRPPTRLSPSPPIQRRRVPSRSPQVVSATGKGNGRPRAQDRDSRLAQERRITPTAGPSTAQRGSRSSRQTSGRGSGTAQGSSGGGSRHPQQNAEVHPQQFSEEERETSGHVDSQASTERYAGAAGILREHAHRQKTGRRVEPGEQGMRSHTTDVRQRGDLDGGAQTMYNRLGTELSSAGGPDSDPQTAAWDTGSALQGTSSAQGPQAGPASGFMAGCQVWATGTENSGISAVGRERAAVAVSAASQGVPPPLVLPQVHRRGDGEGQQPRTAPDIGTVTATGTNTTNATGQVDQIPGAGARSRTGGRAVPRPDLGAGASGTRPCRAWLLGHSYIHWAAQRATFHQADGQLGFQQAQVQLRWVSRRGLKWEEIVPLVVQKAKEFGPPDIIVIHAGGNDVGQCPMKFLIKDIRRDCLRLWSLFPEAVLIWSEIIPRALWRGAHSHQAVNRSRIKINRAVSKFVQGNGGIVVRHMDLEKDRGYFRPDGVHLNDLGLDLFNFSLQEAITLAWRAWRCMLS